jgi:hypothetical protein
LFPAEPGLDTPKKKEKGKEKEKGEEEEEEEPQPGLCFAEGPTRPVGGLLTKLHAF